MTTVSVVTPTWRRHQLLIDRCIPSVAAQTYPLVEHVVVSDGPDPALATQLAGHPVVYVELAQHADDPCNYGARARNRGLEVATGDFIAYLDDDNAFRPRHVQALVAALESNPDADFAYARMVRHPIEDEIGAAPPQVGQIDSSLLMHRRGVPERLGLWPVPAPYAVDWELLRHWLASGARWTFVPEVTVDYWLTGAFR